MLLDAVGEERFVFCDEKGGAHPQEQYLFLRKLLRRGDCLYLDRLDSLGTNLMQMAEQWRLLTEEYGVDIVVLEGETYLNSRRMQTAVQDGITQQEYFLFLLRYLHEMQRNRARDNRKSSSETAGYTGKKIGRPRLQIDEVLFAETEKRGREKEITVEEACRIIGCTRSSWYKYIKEKRYLTDENNAVSP